MRVRLLLAAPKQPLFGSSLFDGRTLYVTNLALDLRLATGSPASQTIDSQWTDQVKSYTVSKIRTNFKPLGREEEE